MNEQLQKEIIKIIQGTTEFTKDQMPEVLRQWLIAEAYSTHAATYLSIGVVIVGLVLVAVLVFKEKEEFAWWPLPLGILASILLLCGTICSIGQSVDLWQIENTPKAYLLKNLVRAVKN